MTHEELQELLNNADFQPHPDPDWDYYQVWEGLHKIRDEITEALAYISQHESATEQIDSEVKKKLTALTCSFEDLEKTCL